MCGTKGVSSRRRRLDTPLVPHIVLCITYMASPTHPPPPPPPPSHTAFRWCPWMLTSHSPRFSTLPHTWCTGARPWPSTPSPRTTSTSPALWLTQECEHHFPQTPISTLALTLFLIRAKKPANFDSTTVCLACILTVYSMFGTAIANESKQLSGSE